MRYLHVFSFWFTLLELSILSAGDAGAQLSRGGKPPSFESIGAAGATFDAFAGEVPIEILPPPDIDRLKAEDEVNGPRPFRYGDLIETSIGLVEHGRWDQIQGGTIVWRVQISSPGAYSLGVLFHEFDLPSTRAVYLYDPEREQLLGAYTEDNEQEDGMLAIEPVHGDRLVIEYVQVPGDAEMPRLRVGSVVHDYRDLFARLRSPAVARSGTCLVDVNCPRGAPYQDLKRSVIEITVNGWLCSASLLNNTAWDGTPYMLTAEHCGDQTNGIQIFGYETTGCNLGSSNSKTLSGSKRLASTIFNDSQLCVLNSTPPQSYAPFFAGWTRRQRPQGPMISIHHALGLPKQISIDDGDAVVQFDFRSVDWDVGMIDLGSSGAPLFTGLGRVVGPACCVTNFDCDTQVAIYGRFDKFYDTRNLGRWLDPLGTNALGLGGYDPFTAAAEVYNTSS